MKTLICITILLLGFQILSAQQTDSILIAYEDQRYTLVYSGVEDLERGIGKLVEKDRKKGAEKLLDILYKDYVKADTTNTIKPIYDSLNQVVSAMVIDPSAPKFLFTTGKFENSPYTSSDEVNENVIDKSEYTSADWLIESGKQKNKGIAYGISGMILSSVITSLYAIDQNDAFLYVGAGGFTISAGVSIGFAIKGNKSLIKAGEAMKSNY